MCLATLLAAGGGGNYAGKDAISGLKKDGDRKAVHVLSQSGE